MAEADEKSMKQLRSLKSITRGSCGELLKAVVRILKKQLTTLLSLRIIDGGRSGDCLS